MEITNDTLFKVLNEDGSCYHGGRGGWHLPANGKPGKWMPELDADKLDPCAYGYHILRPSHLISWLGPALFVVEYKGRMVEENDKLVVSHARLLEKVSTWNERSARLFAADCAEHVLRFFEDKYPDDKRPREAIQASRDYANGLIRAAAGAAAGDAAWAAAWDAARAAAWAAAGDAAWAAARDAAWAAAGAAAWDAAWAAEQKWQTDRLMEYLKREVN